MLFLRCFLLKNNQPQIILKPKGHILGWQVSPPYSLNFLSRHCRDFDFSLHFGTCSQGKNEMRKINLEGIA